MTNPFATMTNPAWADSDRACPYFLIQRQVFFIPAGTQVRVSDMGGTMRDHTLKGNIVFEIAARRYGEHSGEFYQFSTGHPKWVYMYVPKYINGKHVRISYDRIDHGTDPR